MIRIQIIKMEKIITTIKRKNNKMEERLKKIFLFLGLFGIIKIIIGRVSMNRKGQALVEFILILPIFLLILFAVVDFGMILSNKNELENISADVVSMIKNKDNLDDIRGLYPDITIDTSSDNKYTTIKIYKSIDVMTPGLNLVLGDSYEIVVERIIPNV